MSSFYNKCRHHGLSFLKEKCNFRIFTAVLFVTSIGAVVAPVTPFLSGDAVAFPHTLKLVSTARCTEHEAHALFNDALNTFYLRLHVCIMYI